MQCFSAMTPYQCPLGKTRRYIRIFCTGLLGVNFVLLLCLSPLHWVQFVVLKEEKVLTGLWTVCDNDLCWNHTPKASYYFYLARILFLISALVIFIILLRLITSFTKETGDKIYIDLGISISSFISGICLLLCLVLFLIQVKLYSRNILEFQFLLVYYLNWCGSVFYMTVGFLSGFSHIS
ncbi:transmembrane protein 202-like isoform X2 [Talpa occidentalis]|nr:transmembrane protein 202-like isoform X2 [Talpa occidentalis]